MPSFAKILSLCESLSQDLSDVVFIGGVAVYLHAAERARESVPLEASHDADFMISFSDYGILKDAEEIIPNRRLAKQQMLVEGVEFDIYVEKINNLRVPYDEVLANSVVVRGVRLACLEHLLVLKLEALSGRGHSSKGDKDRRDVAKVGLLLGPRVRCKLIAPYVRPELERLLDEVAKSSVFYDLCGGNARRAKKVRAAFADFVRSA